MSEFNIKPQITTNGEEAIKMSFDNRPELIIMDMNMPVMDGIEATKAIRNIDRLKEIPIIGLSADAFDNSNNNALDTRMNDYLTKPVNMQSLMQVLNKYLKVS